ncbi:APC family permease [Limibacillus sp. MBR-115]|uniref:APC family permease n=1 Tax=Limibacillus sp. MBR-115 TaxID=3156465 RepID=UPI0033968991
METVLPQQRGAARQEAESGPQMRRDVNWWQVVFIAAGSPALVMFSLGGISAVTGTISPLVWFVSVMIGFVAIFTYAEIAGMHPNKSGGTAVYGATAWVRYSKIIAPMSIWSNWLAWSPILAIGSGLGSGYLLSIFLPADHALNTWQLTLIDLGFLKNDLSIRINTQFIVGTVLMVIVWSIQHAGISRTARVQIILTLGGIIPLMFVTIIPLIVGKVEMNNFTPFVPLNGEWNLDGWGLMLGGMFLAAWSAYAAENAVCYMSEMKDPRREGAKAIIWSGVLCVVLYSLVPFVFQGVLGTEYMLSPGIVTGEGVGVALASMIGGGTIIEKIVVVMLTFTLFLAIMTAMAGSSRTLYQGGHDGWMPKFLDNLNENGVPTRAMWTDLAFNALLLLMSDYLFVLAVSAVNYVLFHYLNLNAGWIHRIDNARATRPYRAPFLLFVGGIALAYVNAFLIGAGANLWGNSILFIGLVAAFISTPLFWYRHHVVDKGKFPEHMLADLIPEGEDDVGPTKAGNLPYLALAGGVVAMMAGYVTFWLV